MAVYGYCRVSTVQQVEKESLEVQERQLMGYAMMNDWTIDRMYIERGISGSKPLNDRPQGALLLSALQAGDVILTTRLDRMFRSALDALDTLKAFKAKDIKLHMLDLGGEVGNGVSKLVFTILSAVAEDERDRIRERVQTVKTDQKQRGRYLGGIMVWGYEKGADGSLQAVPEKQAAIQRMQELRASGASLRAIADAMRADGHELSHEAVRQVLARAGD